MVGLGSLQSGQMRRTERSGAKAACWGLGGEARGNGLGYAIIEDERRLSRVRGTGGSRARGNEDPDKGKEMSKLDGIPISWFRFEWYDSRDLPTVTS